MYQYLSLSPEFENPGQVSRLLQAMDLEPQQSVIKEGLGLLKSFAAKKIGQQDVVDAIGLHAKTWTEIIVTGTRLSSGNKQLKGFTGKMKDFFNESGSEHGMNTLRAIVSMRKKLLGLQKTLESIEKSQHDHPLQLSDGEESPLQTLLQMRMPEGWIVELNSEAFDDAVSFLAMTKSEQLMELKTKFQDGMQQHLEKKKRDDPMVNVDQDYFHELGMGGPNCWKAGLDENSGFEEVLEMAKKTFMLLLPPVAMRDFADSFMKVARGLQSIVSRCLFKFSLDIWRLTKHRLRLFVGCSYIRHTYIHTCMHACIHTYIHTYICTYVRTYVRT